MCLTNLTISLNRKSVVISVLKYYRVQTLIATSDQIHERLAKDSNINKYGRELIGINKAWGLIIANDRLFADLRVGDVTRIGT